MTHVILDGYNFKIACFAKYQRLKALQGGQMGQFFANWATFGIALLYFEKMK
jgi:hypothetical protein